MSSSPRSLYIACFFTALIVLALITAFAKGWVVAEFARLISFETALHNVIASYEISISFSLGSLLITTISIHWWLGRHVNKGSESCPIKVDIYLDGVPYSLHGIGYDGILGIIKCGICAL